MRQEADGRDGQAQGDVPGFDSSIGGLLHLIGSGVGGQILMALGAGPLRTEQLTERIEDFSSRSVYRRVTKMVAQSLIDRSEEPGVPSTVILSLSEPEGRELFRLVRIFAGTAMARLPGEGRPAHTWSSLDLLGELWKLGFVEEMSHRSRSLAELNRGPHGMTYHQVKQRLGSFVTTGLLVADPPKGHGKRYELTDHGRRRMALVAGLGRWRRHAVTDGAMGLTLAEMSTVLRVVLPLTSLPEHVGERIDLVVTGARDSDGDRATSTLQGLVGVDEVLRCNVSPEPSVGGSATATVNTWFAALLDGNRGRIRVRGDLALVDAFLTQVHEVLWEKEKILASV